MTNEYGRYRYFRINRRPDSVLLLRDDGYRWWLCQERNLARERASLPVQEGTEDWDLLMEYKHFNFSGFAEDAVETMLAALQPAPIDTIDPRFIEE